MDASFRNSERIDFPPHKPESSLLSQRLFSGTQQQKQRKYPAFLLKGALVAIAIALLPLFPSEPPEFTNHTIFTRGWELLRLAVIGIAVCYGLFSRLRGESEKEVQARIDSTQSYVAKILQVSTVFENEADREPYTDPGNNNKAQSWSSLYSPSEPMIMVADEDSRRREKPLFLPVRSLKSGLPDSEPAASVQRVQHNPWEKPRNAESIRNARREIGVSNLDGDDVAESVVLRSPIPWGSRSATFEKKKDSSLPPLNSMSHPVSEPELQRLKKSTSRIPPSSMLPESSSASRSPSISPSHSVSPSRRRAPVPKISSNNSLPTTVSATIDVASFSCVNELGIESNNSLPKNLNPSKSFDESLLVKSVRTIRRSGSSSSLRGGEDDRDQEEKRKRRSLTESESKKVEISELQKQDSDHASLYKSEVQGVKIQVEDTSVPRKSRTFQPPPPPPVELYEWYQRNWRRAKEKMDELRSAVDNDVSNSDDEEDADGDREESQEQRKEEHDHNKHDDDKAVELNKINMGTESDANVDKKADEFIAKFREQIRLQRIESIKRASGQTKKSKSNLTK